MRSQVDILKGIVFLKRCVPKSEKSKLLVFVRFNLVAYNAPANVWLCRPSQEELIVMTHKCQYIANHIRQIRIVQPNNNEKSVINLYTKSQSFIEKINCEREEIESEKERKRELLPQVVAATRMKLGRQRHKEQTECMVCYALRVRKGTAGFVVVIVRDNFALCHFYFPLCLSFSLPLSHP